MGPMSLRTFHPLSIGVLVGIGGGLAGCMSPPPPNGPPDTQQGEDAFFIGTELPTQSLPAGGQIDLTGGGRIRVPRSSPGGAAVSLVEGSLKADANQLFQEWNEGISLTGSVHKISVVPNGQGPAYLIVELPAFDPSARIYVAAVYIDPETENPAWTAVPGSYDPQTGMVTAAVGLGLLDAVDQNAAAGQKGAAAFQGGPLTYNGYVGVGIGGQQFNAQIVFFADEPTDQVEVRYDDPPIEVRGRVGASLSNITHQPLDSLTVNGVTGRFGPRTHPVTGVARTPHRGVDYQAADGTTVYAAGDGVVTAVQWQDANNHGAGAGFYVKIDHGNGEVTKYFHLTDPAQGQPGVIGPVAPGCTNLGVCVGDRVTGGQPIASSDSTGRLTGPHLHYETWQDGVPVDPTLIYDELVTATIAMAIDFEVQPGTEQQFLLTRGIITPEDMMPYNKMVQVKDIEHGEHRLQFVVTEPSGTFEILATVPLVVIDLNGRWLDHGSEDREVIVAQAGNMVSAVFVESFVCDHRDGMGTTSETTDDFVGTLDGLTITGMVKVCAFGCEEGDTSCPPNGIIDLPFTLFVDPGGDILDGFWLDEDGNERGFSLSRLEEP